MRRLALLVLLPSLLTATALAMATEEEGFSLRAYAHLAGRAIGSDRPSPAELTLQARLFSESRFRSPTLASLKQIEIALHHITFESSGLPRCPLSALRGASHQQALARCGNAVVGDGSLRWPIRCSGTRCRPVVPDTAAIPTDPLVAFNGVFRRSPAIFAQATGYEGRADFVLIFELRDNVKGRVSLVADASPSYRSPDSVTGLTLSLRRRYRVHGRPRSYLYASCPAGTEVEEAPAMGRMAFGYADGSELASALSASCGPKPH